MDIKIIYLIIINLLAFLIYAMDKLFAKFKMWRVPEILLLFLVLIGGSVGAYFAMQLCRHKTLHLKFKYGVPFIFVFQLCCGVYAIMKY